MSEAGPPREQRRREADAEAKLAALVARIRACRVCRDDPDGKPLPHEPRPVLRPSTTARIAVFSQAPGTRVHASGMPFTDASGVRLRSWMGVTDAEFYDDRRIAIVPMGFCFPGQDRKGGDLPPRPECARTWRAEVMAAMLQLELVLLVGLHAQRWHLGPKASSLTANVELGQANVKSNSGVHLVPMPHPSWRNNGWLRANPWFERDLLPLLKSEIRSRMVPIHFEGK